MELSSVAWGTVSICTHTSTASIDSADSTHSITARIQQSDAAADKDKGLETKLDKKGQGVLEF